MVSPPRPYAPMPSALMPSWISILSASNARAVPRAFSVSMSSESRSQELVEEYLCQHGVKRRELLHSPHFLSIPLVIASTDLIVTVPLPVGELFAHIADIQVLEPPFPIPAFDLKQHWHRCQHDDPANRWLRAITLELFGEDGSGLPR